MFGAVPKRAWSRKCPADEQNRCLLSMNCLLVKTDDRLILLDTGVGTKDLDKLAYYDFQALRDIRELVIEAGFCPEDVTDVVLSHLHFDHCGGCTYRDEAGQLQVSFPKAKHYVGQRQWENFLRPNPLEVDSFRREDLLPVQKAGLLTLVNKPFELFSGFHLDLFDGHTFGQLAAWFETEDELIIFPGDVIPTQAHLSDEWISAYDIEPLRSLESKRRVKAWAEGKTSRYVFYH